MTTLPRSQYARLAKTLFHAEQPLLVFVGAGLSISSGAPSAAAIAESLSESLAGSVPDDELRDFIQRSPLQQVFELYAQQFGSKRLVGELQRLLPANLQPNPIHTALARLPVDLIITTNFDSLIESALSSVGRSFVSISTDTEMKKAPKGAVRVIHLNGILSQPNTIQLGQLETESYLRDQSPIQRYMRVAFSGHSALFLGISLANPDFQSVFRAYRGRPGADPLWVAVTNRVSALERDLWSGRGVKQVQVPFDGLAEFLEEIRKQIEKPDEPPATTREHRVLLLGEKASPRFVKTLQDQLGHMGIGLVRADQQSLSSVPVINSLIDLAKNVVAAVVMLDMDDQQSPTAKPAPRPNVLFELGLLIGRLGSDRVVIVSSGHERLPSDIAGMRYLFIDDARPGKVAERVSQWVKDTIPM